MRLSPPHQVLQRRAERQKYSDSTKGHGRLERRKIETTTALNTVVACLGWSSVRQVFRVPRQRILRDRDTGILKTVTDVAYGMTDLARDQSDAKRLLAFNRDQWGIENKVHYIRDVKFCEDAHRARSGNRPHVMAALRNTALAFCRLYNYLNLAEARRDFAWNPSRIFNILAL